MKKSLLAACCGFFLCFNSGLYAQQDVATEKLIRISNISKAAISKLLAEGYDVPKKGVDFAELVVSPKKYRDLKNQGFKIKVLINDVDEYVKEVQKAQTKAESYFTFKTMSSQLKTWSEKFPKICKLESIGQSWEKRDIWGLKISDNPNVDEKEPAALLMGAHHAREWPSFEVPMATAKKLLEEYGKNPAVTELVNNREIWIVPMVNPDGVEYSQTKSRMWRKNRRKNGSSYGVDPNRNYGYQWGNVGASSSGYSDTYHGPGPFSEPETSAIRDFARREKFQASISFHTYSQLILYPFGYGYNIHNPDEKIFKKMAYDMSKFNRYRPQNSAELYPAMGDSDDFLYGDLNCLSFTFELCSTFIPRPSEIEDFNSKNIPAVMYLIEKAGTYGSASRAGEDLIDSLDFNTAINGVKDSVSLFGTEGDIVMRNDVLNRIDRMSKRVAKLVVEDLEAGETNTWEEVKNTKQAILAQRYIKNRVLFNSVHGKTYRSDVIEELKAK
jgi:hypothetical protein